MKSLWKKNLRTYFQTRAKSRDHEWCKSHLMDYAGPCTCTVPYSTHFVPFKIYILKSRQKQKSRTITIYERSKENSQVPGGLGILRNNSRASRYLYHVLVRQSPTKNYISNCNMNISTQSFCYETLNNLHLSWFLLYCKPYMNITYYLTIYQHWKEIFKFKIGISIVTLIAPTIANYFPIHLHFFGMLMAFYCQVNCENLYVSCKWDKMICDIY